MKQKLLNEKIKEYGKRVLDIEKKLNIINDNYEKINNNIEDIYDNIHDSSTDITLNSNSNSNKIQRKYNTRNKKIKYKFEDVDEDALTDLDDPDYTDESDDDYQYDNINDNINDNKSCSIKNVSLINNYIDSYINTNSNNTNTNTNNTNSKYNKDNKLKNYNKCKKEHSILKDQAITFYTNLIKNQEHLTINQIYQHIDYFINTTLEQRLHILTTLDTIINLEDNKIPRLFKILNSTLDTYYKKIALNKIQLLEKMKAGENEYFKLSNWIDTLLDIPFNIYKTPKYLDTQITNKPSKYLKEAYAHLDTIIYGQKNTKTHIIEILAKMISNPKTLGSVFAIHGEAGTGKTTLIKDGLSKVFGLPFIFISLGGAQDRTFLSGSNYVYEGSACGKILQSLKQAQCMNPIFYFDELDKISSTDKGQEIINMLIHLTDYTQNNTFMDDYMDGISIDLSRAIFIFSFNDKNKISPILLDRMEIIKFHPYTLIEKKHIATHFLLPNIIKNIFGENKKNISLGNSIITDSQLENIVKIPNSVRKNYITKQSKVKSKVQSKVQNKLISKHKYGGVRYIKKRLEKIVSKFNLDNMLNKM